MRRSRTNRTTCRSQPSSSGAAPTDGHSCIGARSRSGSQRRSNNRLLATTRGNQGSMGSLVG
eukprot:6735701-Prymnesium_polylepis.2